MLAKARILTGLVAAGAMLAATAAATPALADGGYYGGYGFGYHGGYGHGFHGGHHAFRHHRFHGHRGIGRTGAAVLGVMGGIVIGSIIADSQRRYYDRPDVVYVPQTR
ncbi:MAG: hypothetical protein D6782_13855, partial [Alphaproteobacteria bacterium]